LFDIIDAFDVTELFDDHFAVENFSSFFDDFDVELFDERFVAEQFFVFFDPPGSHTRFSEISFVV